MRTRVAVLLIVAALAPAAKASIVIDSYKLAVGGCGAEVTVFITSSTDPWTVPDDYCEGGYWHVIGGGGGGADGTNGFAGHGGGYAGKAYDTEAGAQFEIKVGAAGVGSTDKDNTDGGTSSVCTLPNSDSCYNYTQESVIVYASGAFGTGGNPAGRGIGRVGDVLTAGGVGGHGYWTAAGYQSDGGGGGGGAGGPDGDGGDGGLGAPSFGTSGGGGGASNGGEDGQDGSGSNNGGAGGGPGGGAGGVIPSLSRNGVHGSSGGGGGGGAQAGAGGNGGDGEEWQTHGPGGGGGGGGSGGSVEDHAGTGGLYGGGGGAAGYLSVNSVGGDGGPGLVVFVYKMK